MTTWYEVDRLDAGTERLRSNRTDPALAALMAVRIDLIRWVLFQLGINLKV